MPETYLYMFLSAAGGLSLFLWSMGLFSTYLAHEAGGKIKSIIRSLSSTPGKGFITGALITTVLQSSSLTTVMVTGLVNARIIRLEQAAGIIIGANVGTTVTSQLLSFKLHQAALPVIGAAFIVSLLPWEAPRKTGQLLIKFGVMLLGFNIMVESLSPLGEQGFWTAGLAAGDGDSVRTGILTGLIASAVLQSSSAVSGMAMAMIQEGGINLPVAVALIMGADAGTCITALAASLKTGSAARLAALTHLIFNILSIFLVWPWFNLFVTLAEFTASEASRQLANAHTMYNLWGALFIFPVINYFFNKKGYL